MTERDRLAALLRECDPDETKATDEWNLAYADRLIAAGWTDLPVERLARALHKAGVRCSPNIPYCRASHRGHAAAIAAAYREDAG